MTSDLLTVAEVAAYLRRTPRNTYPLIGNQIPAVKIGGDWRIRASDVQAFIDANTVTNRSTKARVVGRRRSP